MALAILSFDTSVSTPSAPSDRTLCARRVGTSARDHTTTTFSSPEGEGFPPSPEETLMASRLGLCKRSNTQVAAIKSLRSGGRRHDRAKGKCDPARLDPRYKLQLLFGARRLSSSNQSRTTWIRACSFPATLVIKKRCPSGKMSNPHKKDDASNNTLGLPALNVGVV